MKSHVELVSVQRYNKNDVKMLRAEDWVCVMDHFIRSDRETKECFLEFP
jgi:hypothetical protein